mgnify:CR=1 FL=1
MGCSRSQAYGQSLLQGTPRAACPSYSTEMQLFVPGESSAAFPEYETGVLVQRYMMLHPAVDHFSDQLYAFSDDFLNRQIYDRQAGL